MSEAQSQEQVVPETANTQEKAEPSGATQAEEQVYYQKDVNKIAANEKRDGRTSAINEFLEKARAVNPDIESVDEVIAGYSEYQGIQEAVTTEADRERTRAEKAEAKAKTAEELYLNTKREFALKDALRDAGVVTESLGFVMRGIDKSQLSVDKDGNVSGVEEAVEAAREEAPLLFGEGQGQRPRIDAPQTTGTGVQSPANGGMSPEEAHANWLLSMFDNSR